MATLLSVHAAFELSWRRDAAGVDIVSGGPPPIARDAIWGEAWCPRRFFFGAPFFKEGAHTRSDRGRKGVAGWLPVDGVVPTPPLFFKALEAALMPRVRPFILAAKT